MPNNIHLLQAFGHNALMYTFLNITIDLKRRGSDNGKHLLGV